MSHSRTLMRWQLSFYPLAYNDLFTTDPQSQTPESPCSHHHCWFPHFLDPYKDRTASIYLFLLLWAFPFQALQQRTIYFSLTLPIASFSLTPHSSCMTSLITSIYLIFGLPIDLLSLSLKRPQAVHLIPDPIQPQHLQLCLLSIFRGTVSLGQTTRLFSPPNFFLFLLSSHTTCLDTFLHSSSRASLLF